MPILPRIDRAIRSLNDQKKQCRHGNGPLPDGALQFENVAKSFGGTRALKGVSFSVDRGEVVALLGENGAGKSTLIKTLGGIYRADGGRVAIGGTTYRHQPSGVTGCQPVAFIHQDLGLIEWMTVAENVSLAHGYPGKGGFPRRGGLGRLMPIDWKAAETRTAEALQTVGCDIDPTTRVHNLSRTEKSLVAIARALAVECDFLVLDEPTASLPADEVERLFVAMRGLKAANVGMIYVSHRLDEIFRIADRVVVMRDGAKVGDQAVADTTADELVQLIIGRSALDAFERAHTSPGRPRVQVQDLRTPRAGPVSFEIREGELLGLAGLRGAGQEQIGRALFGAIAHTGTVTLDGRRPDLSSPKAALDSGIGLIARDRVEESIAASLSIRENTFINPRAAGRGLLSFRSPVAEGRAAAELGRAVGLRPDDPTLAIEGLSGGNQQKVVVGRWLATGRHLLIAEDPTAGVDVGAKADIYRLIARALKNGLAVVVVSTDFEEVAHICHRALVFSHGRIVAELDGAALTTTSLITAASASNAA